MKPACLTNASTTDGDTALAGLLLNSLPLNRPVYAACLATVGPAGTRIATIGCDLQKTFHIGSISKALNGLIYTDMVQTRLISPHDRLEEHLPLAGTAAGEATLESCLTHTSGLPATGGGIRSAARALGAVLTGGDPQPENLDDLMKQLRRSRIRHPGALQLFQPRCLSIGPRVSGRRRGGLSDPGAKQADDTAGMPPAARSATCTAKPPA